MNYAFLRYFEVILYYKMKNLICILRNIAVNELFMKMNYNLQMLRHQTIHSKMK